MKGHMEEEKERKTVFEKEIEKEIERMERRKVIETGREKEI